MGYQDGALLFADAGKFQRRLIIRLRRALRREKRDRGAIDEGYA